MIKSRYLHNSWRVLRTSVREFQKDGAADIGAVIAFYTIFSLAPLLIVVIGVAGTLWNEQSAKSALFSQISRAFGPESAALINTMLSSTTLAEVGVVGSALGILTLLYGTTKIFALLQNALNKIWHVANSSSDIDLFKIVSDRLQFLAIVVGIGVLLVASVVVDAGLTAFFSYTTSYVTMPEVVLHASSLAVTLSGLSILFALLFKTLPDRKLSWKDVWKGAIVTALLFSLGKYIIALYLGHSLVGDGFGPAASFVILLLWIYYSSQIFLLGAEITEVLARDRESIIENTSRKIINKTEGEDQSMNKNSNDLQSLLKHRRRFLLNKVMNLPQAKQTELQNITSLSTWVHFHPWCTTGAMFVGGATLGNVVLKNKDNFNEPNTTTDGEKKSSDTQGKAQKERLSLRLFKHGVGFLSSYISTVVISKISKRFEDDKDVSESASDHRISNRD